MYIISGYQKSGTEWLKFILVDLFMGPQKTWTEYTNAIPGLRDPKLVPQCGWAKTHEYIIHDMFKGVIHAVRHPLDVAISSYRYRAVIDGHIDHDDAMSNRNVISRYIDLFIEKQGDPFFNKMNSGTWEMSVLNAISDQRTLIIKHEDLRGPNGQFRLKSVLFAFGFVFTKEQIATAFANNTPMKMRARDDRNFLARIQMDQYMEFVSESQLERAREAFPTALELGYKI